MQTHNFHTHTQSIKNVEEKKARGQPNCTSLGEIIVQSLYRHLMPHTSREC